MIGGPSPVAESRDALEIIRKEREEMERQYAALREENEKLKKLIGKDNVRTDDEEDVRKKNRMKLSSSQFEKNQRVIVKKKTNLELVDNDENRTDDEDEVIQYSSSDNDDTHQLSIETRQEIANEFYLDNEISETSEGNSPEISPTYLVSRHRFDSDMDESVDILNRSPQRRQTIPQPPQPFLSHQRPTSATQSLYPDRALALPRPDTNNELGNLPLLLWKGGILWKIPYNGRGLPERRLVMIKRVSRPTAKSKPVRILGPDLLFGSLESRNPKSGPGIGYISFPPTVIWANPDIPDDLSSARELSLGIGTHIVEGHQSPAFWKTQSRGTPLPAPHFCFSLVTSTRSLDLAAESIQEANAWKEAFHTLLIMMSSNTEWAIDKLHRTKPTWRHDSLDYPPDPRKKERVQSTPVNPQNIAAGKTYEEAAKKSRIKSSMSLKDQMFAASRAGDYDTLKTILDTKISVNLMSGDAQDTPLMIACRYGMDDIARLCLHYGARNDPHPDFGQTALHCAVESKSFGCARVLLDAAAPSGSDSLIANLKDVDGYSSLHLACKVGDLKIVKLLVGHGADISLRDQNFRTAIHTCSYYGHKSILSYLLDSGGDCYLELMDSDGRTALHYAAESGHLNCVKLLLETAANPVAQDTNYLTPYQVAVRAGHEKICHLLLEYQRIASDGRQRFASGTFQVEELGDFHRNIERASNGPIHYSHLMSSSSDPQLNSSIFQLSPKPVPLMRNFSSPLPNVALPYDSEVVPLPRPHTSRPSSAANSSTHTPGSVGLSSPSPQLKEKFRFPSNSPLSSPSQRKKSLIDTPVSEKDGKNKNTTVPPIFIKRDVSGDNLSLPRPTVTPTQKSSPLISQKKSDPSTQMKKNSQKVDNIFQDQFDHLDGEWSVYYTVEGYPYFLESRTQHSQWEDPRQHGILVYNERTAGYVKCSKLPQYNSLLNNTGSGKRNSDANFVPEVVKTPPRDSIMEKSSLQNHQTVKLLPTHTNSPRNRLSPVRLEDQFNINSASCPQPSGDDIKITMSGHDEGMTWRVDEVTEHLTDLAHHFPKISQVHNESVEFLDEVLDNDQDRCEACSESGDVSTLLDSFQLETSKLPVSVGSDSESPFVSPQGNLRSPHHIGTRDEKSEDELEVLVIAESEEVRSHSDQRKASHFPTSIVDYPLVDINTLETLNTENMNHSAHHYKIDPSNLGKFSHEGIFEFGDEPEESSEPLDADPQDKSTDVANVRNQDHRIRSLNCSPENVIQPLEVLELLPSTYRNKHTLNINSSTSNTKVEKIPSMIQDIAALKTVDSHLDWDDSDIEDISSKMYSVPQKQTDQTLCQSQHENVKPSNHNLSVHRTLSAEELERQKIFLSENGSYGNGGSLFEGSVDLNSASVILRTLDEILEENFSVCSHPDLLITAIQRLDSLGGQIKSKNLLKLKSALPSVDQLSSVLIFFRSTLQDHPYSLSELLLNSVSSFYPLFLLEIEGLICSLDIKSDVHQFVSSEKQFIVICNEILVSNELKVLIAQMMEVMRNNDSTSYSWLDIISRMDNPDNKVILANLLRKSGYHSGFVRSTDWSCLNFVDAFQPFTEVKNRFSTLISSWEKMLLIFDDICLHQNKKNKFDDYLGRFETEITNLTDVIDTLNIRHEELLKKVILVISLFDEKIKDDQFLNILKFLRLIIEILNDDSTCVAPPEVEDGYLDV